jgi:hypothetical protein
MPRAAHKAGAPLPREIAPTPPLFPASTACRGHDCRPHMVRLSATRFCHTPHNMLRAGPLPRTSLLIISNKLKIFFDQRGCVD